MKTTIFLLTIVSILFLTACKVDTDIDDAVSTIADTLGNGDSDGVNNSGNNTGTGINTNPNTVDDDQELLNGIAWLDDSDKGEGRFLMGTYYYNKYFVTEDWKPPVVMRAYSRMDGQIDFEDMEGHLLWIANIVDEETFEFTTDIYVNSIAPLESNCTCSASYDGWFCSCGFAESPTTYTMNLSRMGLDENDVHDAENYMGILDENDYLLLVGGSQCDSYGYELPGNVSAMFRGRRIDFEDSTGDLLWSADLHEDETFDFTVGGFADSYNRPTVSLTCGCEFVAVYWTWSNEPKAYDILDDDNHIYCNCESSEGVNDCQILYSQQQ